MIQVYEDVTNRIDLDYYDSKGEYITLYNNFNELLEENGVLANYFQEYYQEEYDKDFNFKETNNQEFEQAVSDLISWKMPKFTKEQATKPFIVRDYENSEHIFFGEGSTADDIIDFVTAP